MSNQVNIGIIGVGKAGSLFGQAVLCDKPMCLNSGDADRMIEACDRAGVILMIGFIERFNSAFRVMKDRIRNGHIGDPVSVLGCVQRKEAPELAGARDGKRTVLVYEAVKEAARTGASVSVADPARPGNERVK